MEHDNLIIFNIGAHKTGTKSLKEFLKKTSVKVDDNTKWYYNIKYQRRIIKNNNYKLIKKYIKTQSKINFFEDSPYNINEIYKYLYKNFHNSKFIMTTRDSNKWFESFRKWCVIKDLNNGFNSIMIIKMYGGKIILENKDLIIKNYEERISNIKKYFENTDRLLVLETDNKKINKIKLICEFLNLNYELYKNIEYPHFTHR